MSKTSRIIHIDDTDYAECDALVNGVTVIDFYADWCGPCKRMSPEFEAASTELTDVNFIKVNCDEAPKFSEIYSVTALPTLVVLKDGKPMGLSKGGMNKNKIIEFIKSKSGM